MKRIFALSIAVLCFAAIASAQPRAIGLRGGYGAEISYQHNFGGNFVEADLGWTPQAIGVTAMYDFNFELGSNFNFYAGPGATAGIYSSYDGENYHSGINLGIAGQIGVEYQFQKIPFNISLDWRPTFGFIGGVGFAPFGGAFGFRYRF